MRTRNIVLLLLLCLPLIGRSTAPAGAVDTTANYVPDEVLVGIDPPAANSQAYRAATQQIISQIERLAGRADMAIDAIHAYRFKLIPGLTVQGALNRINATGLVIYASPNYIRRTCATPDDPFYSNGNQYGPQKVQANLAWNIWNPQASKIIAIVDTGVQATHPDLTDKMLRDAAGALIEDNEITPGAPANDDNGHGSHCAGIAAATINNGKGVPGAGVGIAGIAGWNGVANSSDTTNTKIMRVKVLNSGGSGTDAQVAAGVTFATDRGASVISMSLGGSGDDPTLRAACAYAWSKGVVIVAAAGNSSSSALFYPAAYPNVISVAATDSTDTLASFSNWGSRVDIAAPGVAIYSTYPPSNPPYAFLSGTSMACPHVAGAAVLLASQNPTATNAQIRSALVSNIDPYIPYSGRTIAAGGGRLNVFKALQAISAPTGPTAPANLKAGAGDQQVVLNWDAVSSAASYNVYRGSASGGPYSSQAAGLTTNQYTDTGLTNGTTYYYVVTAVNSVAESPKSNEASATPIAIVRIECGGSQYVTQDGRLFLADTYFSGGHSGRVSNDIANTSDPELYRTFRAGGAGEAINYTLPASNGRYTLKLHFAEVWSSSAGERVFNVDVNSARILTSFDPFVYCGGIFRAGIVSKDIDVTTGRVSIDLTAAPSPPIINAIELIPLAAGGPPSAPTNLRVVGGNQQVTLNWDAVSGAATYKVYRGSTSGGPYSLQASGQTTNQYTDTGLTNGTTYYYVVTAVNGAGESPNSNEASATPVATLRIECGGSQYVTLDGRLFIADTYFNGGHTGRVSNNIANTSDPELYRTFRAGGAGEAINYTLPASNGKYTLKLHFAEVWSTSAGERVFNVNVNGARILTSFDPFVYCGGIFRAGIVSKDIDVTTGGVSIDLTAAPSPPIINAIELIPLAAGGPPSAPTNLRAVGGNQQVTLNWDAVSGATSYKVYRGSTSGGPYSLLASGQTTNQYSDTGLTNGTAYYYVVTAVNGAGESPNSNEASATPVATLRIECGGSQYVTLDGRLFIADTYFNGGHTGRVSNNIANTSDPELYRTFRAGGAGEAINYTLPVSNGKYTLKLHFAEVWSTSPGERVFNVNVNGARILTSFDPFVYCGGIFRAGIVSKDIDVTTGGVSIDLLAAPSPPIINAIELIPVP